MTKEAVWQALPFSGRANSSCSLQVLVHLLQFIAVQAEDQREWVNLSKTLELVTGHSGMCPETAPPPLRLGWETLKVVSGAWRGPSALSLPHLCQELKVSKQLLPKLYAIGQVV